MKRSIFYLVFVETVAIALLSTLSSCTNTVVQTVNVPVHDTTRGPALLRFISMLPNDQVVTVRLTQDESAAPYISVRNVSLPSYLPITPDTAIQYFLYLNNSDYYATLPMPTLQPNSLNTCAFFKDSSEATFEIRNDSMKLRHAPAGKCYLRFVNGLANFPPSGPTLFLDLDTLGKSAFTDTTGNHGVPLAQPVTYRTMNDYTLIPSGAHQVLIRSSQGQLITTPLLPFEAGAYFTARVYGSYPDVHVAVDQD